MHQPAADRSRAHFVLRQSVNESLRTRDGDNSRYCLLSFVGARLLSLYETVSVHCIQTHFFALVLILDRRQCNGLGFSVGQHHAIRI